VSRIAWRERPVGETTHLVQSLHQRLFLLLLGLEPTLALGPLASLLLLGGCRCGEGGLAT